jgi:hypothetical protein
VIPVQGPGERGKGAHCQNMRGQKAAAERYQFHLPGDTSEGSAVLQIRKGDENDPESHYPA